MNIFPYTVLVYLSLESPYFTTEPESRILAEVEKTVHIRCQAMGKWGGNKWSWFLPCLPLSLFSKLSIFHDKKQAASEEHDLKR